MGTEQAIVAVNPIPVSTVLLVDHDADTRQMYGTYLKAAGVAIDEASDGREALAKALTASYDAIVTETALPGMSGHDLCELLRMDVQTRDVAIIVVTADIIGTDTERTRLIADAVLKKPCLPEVVLGEMRRVLELSRTLRQRARDIQERVAAQLARSVELQTKSRARPRTATFPDRNSTMHPPLDPPTLMCPSCYLALTYRRSHMGGVGQQNREQWDYYCCSHGCGNFQYRQRTKKIRKVA